MENHNAMVGSTGGAKTNIETLSDSVEQVENPNTNLNHSDEHQQEAATCGGSPDLAEPAPPPPSPNSARRSSRTPFTNLSQIDADLALARTLQEQERAYMMLRMNNEGSDYGSWEAGSYGQDGEDDYNDFHDDTDVDEDDKEEDDGADLENNEDGFDVPENSEDGEDNNLSVELDPADFSSDEAYARALQDAEDRELAARLMVLARINDREAEDTEDSGSHSQETWEEVDPDELSYEELLALGEVVGCESRGLSADTIASLASVNYKTGSNQNGSNDSCVICRLDYEDGETLTVLSCKHSYHSECVNNWLKINKVCPVCSAEVSTSGNSV